MMVTRTAAITSLSLVCGVASAQGMEFGDRGQGAGMEGHPIGPGIGVALGDPSGIALSYRPGDRTVFQSTVGWSVTNGRFHVSGDYLRNLFLLESDATPDLQYPLYVGVGGRVLIAAAGEDVEKADQETSMGVRFPVGTGLTPRTQAVDVYLEFAPVLLVLPNVRMGWDAAIGVRVYPWGRGKDQDED